MNDGEGNLNNESYVCADRCCICVGQKYEKVYYVLRFNILIWRASWHKEGVIGAAL
jgi:hypothetical protein